MWVQISVDNVHGVQIGLTQRVYMNPRQLMPTFEICAFFCISASDSPFQLQCLWHNPPLFSRESPYPARFGGNINKHITASSNIPERGLLAYHFHNFVSESSSLDVFWHKVYSFVFIKQPDELQNIGMVQTAHHLHLHRLTARVLIPQQIICKCLLCC